ncbi:hypothetical protein [Edaphobacter bradus]|uniref:hypothetical protein n=1 Tax=Edaphobacter bradus TaxID=2259016 RepID=UPI0021DF760A|nr:hypothetical protein [Edaphobacter bradus]
MKYLSVLPIAIFSIALQAQTVGASGAASTAANADAGLSRAAVQSSSAAEANAATTAAAQAGQASASASQATNLSAELTKKIDTRNAKVGDEVEAKTTSTAKLIDGTKLPKGTRLLGKVTETHARSSADKSSHLAFSLDRAVLHDGRELPVHATLTSLARPTALTASTADDMSIQSSGGATAGGGSRSGLLGGVGRTAGGVVGGASNSVGDVGGAVRSGANSVVADTSAVGSNVAASAGSAVALDHVPVANMPGVTLSSATSASSSGSLDAAGRNLSLDSGTQMTLNVSAGQQ